MISVLALLAYAILAGTLGAVAMRRASWVQRAPRLAVAAWQALSMSVLIALLLAGPSLVVPDAHISSTLAELLDACLMVLGGQYANPDDALFHALGAAATLALATRSGLLLVTGLHRARRSRAEHLTHLRLAAHRDPDLDALILDHPTAAAYCLPGRAHAIVLTSAAVRALDNDELAAVLVHERAHLRGHHHLVTAAAQALARTAPFLPVFRWARDEQVRLLEMIADDEAAHRGTRLTVARALVHLAAGSVPAGAVGAADVAALARVRRMLEPANHLGLARRLAITAVLALTPTVPIAIAVTPALTANPMSYCQVSSLAPPI